MKYDKKFPQNTHLLRLAKTTNFPADCKNIKRTAYNSGFSNTMLDFLTLFPADEVFESLEDFMARCDELKLFIKEEKDMPKEILRSPQD